MSTLIQITPQTGSSGIVINPVKMQSGNWYIAGNQQFIPPPTNILNNTASLGLGTVQALPYNCLETVTINGLQMRGTQLAGTFVKIVIYANDPVTNLPTTLLYQTAGLDQSGTFGFRTVALGTPFTMTAGNTYWFGLCASTAHTVTGYPQNGHNLPVIGGNQFDSAFYEYVGVTTFTQSYNTVPATIAGATSYTFGNSIPFIRFKKQ